MVAGWGGRPFADGNDTCNCINGNCRTVPVEVYESRYPWLVENLALTEDSGGAGKYRGGLGSTKTLECTADEIILSYMGDRHRNAPWGLLGGDSGGSAALLIKKANENDWKDVCEGHGKVSPSKFGNVSVHRGDRVRLLSGGGGGYGPVTERAQEMVDEDVREGFVSPSAAAERYGHAAAAE